MVSIKELAEIIARLGGVRVVFDIPSSQEAMGYSTIQRAVLNPSKLEHLGWRPRISLEEALKNYIIK